jgi:hypothetical protein
MSEYDEGQAPPQPGPPQEGGGGAPPRPTVRESFRRGIFVRLPTERESSEGLPGPGEGEPAEPVAEEAAAYEQAVEPAYDEQSAYGQAPEQAPADDYYAEQPAEEQWAGGEEVASEGYAEGYGSAEAPAEGGWEAADTEQAWAPVPEEALPPVEGAGYGEQDYPSLGEAAAPEQDFAEEIAAEAEQEAVPADAPAWTFASRPEEAAPEQEVSEPPAAEQPPMAEPEAAAPEPEPVAAEAPPAAPAPAAAGRPPGLEDPIAAAGIYIPADAELLEGDMPLYGDNERVDSIFKGEGLGEPLFVEFSDLARMLIGLRRLLPARTRLTYNYDYERAWIRSSADIDLASYAESVRTLIWEGEEAAGQQPVA